MALRVVGAGVGRTGTRSLQVALQHLLGGRCYHMSEVMVRPDHVEAWRRAANGTLPDWDQLLAGYEAVVDWPASSFWRELSAANPDAIVLLSVRKSPEAWWHSASRTIFADAGSHPIDYMFSELLQARFSGRWDDPDAAMAAYVRHNDAVRAEIPGERLVEWQPGAGWAPICRALRLPVPTMPFPHLNTAQEYRQSLVGDGLFSFREH